MKKNILSLFILFAGLTFSASLKDVNRAISSNDIVKLKEVLSKDINVEERDSFGGTALHATMFQSQNPEIIQLMLKKGYDINAIGPRNGYTPLHDAVWANNDIALDILLKNGARTDIKGKDGFTPYEKAKRENKKILVEIFEKNGIRK
ncbi:MAG: ankyrin repeat domain-containing protein [Cetobacterium sp.]|uniref:ankyrin repeat domain-containing protein n=1 Tax=Cetobacterium sp. TaxID=2071632 RepID=UPI003EE4F42E